MKTMGLVLGLVLMVAGASVAATQTASYDTYAGWNLVAAPIVPIEPAGDVVFNQFDLMFTTGLTRYDAASGRMIAYDAFADTPGGTFGNVLLGDGYWLNNPDAAGISYVGVPDGIGEVDGQGNVIASTMTDMWISLPGNQLDGVDQGGWQLIGHPFNHPTAFDTGELVGDVLKVTDGSEVKTFGEAADAGWIEGTFTYWDGSAQRMMAAGYFFNDDDSLRPGHGYWVKTKRDNLALIIPAN